MNDWQAALERWVEAGLISPELEGRIRAFEGEELRSRGLQWPVLLAIGLGCFLVGAGILLFVAAHWDQISPGGRFALVLFMVALFHVAGAYFSDRFVGMSQGLHGLGTITLGAGIFLAAQIFNLAEHWPSGIFLWALGALAAWKLLGDWFQGLFFALLLPAWLAAEWEVRAGNSGDVLVSLGLLMMAITYFTAARADERDYLRRGLMMVGGLLVIPMVCFVIIAAEERTRWAAYSNRAPVPLWLQGFAIAVAFGAPLFVAYWLRKRAVIWNAVAVSWAVLLVPITQWVRIGDNMLLYFWTFAGSVAMVYWGVHELRKERVNMGMGGAALSIIAFYLTSFADKLGRSALLVLTGILFLVGAWQLERTRRRLVARIEAKA